MAAAARRAKVLGAPAQWCAPGAQGSVEHPALFKIGTVGPAHQRSPTAANNKARCSDKLELRVGCALRRDQDGLIPPKAVQSFAPTTIGQRLSSFRMRQEDGCGVQAASCAAPALPRSASSHPVGKLGRTMRQCRTTSRQGAAISDSGNGLEEDTAGRCPADLKRLRARDDPWVLRQMRGATTREWVSKGARRAGPAR